MDKKRRKTLMSSLDNLKMHDAGEKPSKSKPLTIDRSDNGPYYPSLYLNSKQAPELVGLEVDDDVTLVIQCKITGHSLDERPGHTRESFDVKIKKIGVVKK